MADTNYTALELFNTIAKYEDMLFSSINMTPTAIIDAVKGNIRNNKIIDMIISNDTNQSGLVGQLGSGFTGDEVREKTKRRAGEYLNTLEEIKPILKTLKKYNIEPVCESYDHQENKHGVYNLLSEVSKVGYDAPNVLLQRSTFDDIKLPTELRGILEHGFLGIKPKKRSYDYGQKFNYKEEIELLDSIGLMRIDDEEPIAIIRKVTDMIFDNNVYHRGIFQNKGDYNSFVKELHELTPKPKK